MNLSHRCALIAALLVFITAAYFRNTRPGWNVNTQFGLTLAIVEQGSLRIDDYHDQPETFTGDKAYFEGHFYCDKSPVTPFLGVPALALHQFLTNHPQDQWNYHAMRYWTTVGSIGLLAAGLAFMLTTLLVRFGVSPPIAAAATALWIAGTPIMGYSIIYYNYTPACAFALGGFMLALPFLTASESFPSPRRPALQLFLAGLLVGLACWTLQTLALLALIMTGALLVRTSPARWISLWPWAVGGIVGVAGYAIYSLFIFGEITSPYRYEYSELFKVEMAKGLMGATWPNIKVLQLITVHPYRGLFVLFPCTAFALFGCLWELRESTRRTIAVITLLFLLGLVLYNSGYYMWWGGWAYAPRHLIPAIPFLALGMIPFLRSATPWRSPALWLIGLALTISAILNLMVISLDPQPPPGFTNELLFTPWLVEQWPLPFFDLLGFVWRGQTDINWGMRLGLKGLASLAPLAILWLIGIAALFYLQWKSSKPTANDADAESQS